jgi:hypothetical protein
VCAFIGVRKHLRLPPLPDLLNINESNDANRSSHTKRKLNAILDIKYIVKFVYFYDFIVTYNLMLIDESKYFWGGTELTLFKIK